MTISKEDIELFREFLDNWHESVTKSGPDGEFQMKLLDIAYQLLENEHKQGLTP